MKLYAGLDEHKDERGVILNCLPDDVYIRSVLYITGVKGAIRANHYHLRDTHYCYIVSGKIKYSHKTVSGAIKSVVLEPGMVVYTPIEEVHKFEFLEDGVFLAMATEPRNQKAYEADTIHQAI